MLRALPYPPSALTAIGVAVAAQAMVLGWALSYGPLWVAALAGLAMVVPAFTAVSLPRQQPPAEVPEDAATEAPAGLPEDQPTSEEAGFAEILQQAAAAGIDVRLDLPKAALSSEGSSAAERIIGAALTELLHQPTGAQCAAKVTLDEVSPAMTIDIADDGPALRALDPRFSLSALATKVLDAGGAFAAGPQPADGQGYRVSVRLPYPPPNLG